MNHSEMAIRRYGLGLLETAILCPFRSVATVLCTANSPGVWDFIVALPNVQFVRFAKKHGVSAVIDDHDTPHGRSVFTRIVSQQWVKRDFGRRLPIALWVYMNALRVQECDKWLDNLICKGTFELEKRRLSDLRVKYLALRQERHNLRYAVRARYRAAIVLIKAAFFKLAVELIYTQEHRPYPYRFLLPIAAEFETEAGKTVLPLLTDFLEAEESQKIIELTDQIIAQLNNMLGVPQEIKDQWWQHLE